LIIYKIILIYIIILMKFSRINIIGYIATFLTIVHLMPQVYKIYETNYTISLSIYSYIILFCEGLLWSIYGFLTDNYLLSIGNIINILFLIYILVKIINNNYNFDIEKDIELDIKKIHDLKWL
jgi:uncharacterized protein with PQ loop repeat